MTIEGVDGVDYTVTYDIEPVVADGGDGPDISARDGGDVVTNPSPSAGKASDTESTDSNDPSVADSIASSEDSAVAILFEMDRPPT